MAIWPLKSSNRVSTDDIPDSDAFVKRASGNKLSTWRDGDSGDAVFNVEHKCLTIGLNIPDTDGMITAARRYSATIAGEVKGIYVLLVAGKGVADSAGLDVPYL